MAAPLAHFDEDWQDFNEFKPSEEDSEDEDRLNSNHHAAARDPPPAAPPDDEDASSDQEEEEEDHSFMSSCEDQDHSFRSMEDQDHSFRSMEELVQGFDRQLGACFGDYGAATDSMAPVQPFTEDGLLRHDGVWNALTDNYGNVMPVDWKTSHTRTLTLDVLQLRRHETVEDQSLDLSDDEDLREQMDMHSIIVSCVSNDEPLFTAEQVIEEIEEMMQQSPDPEDDDSPSQSDLSLVSQDLKRSGSNTSYEDRLRQLSVTELTSTLEEVELSIRRYSEELITALALRDEQEYEKEVKNCFISLLIDVQNRQKEHRELLRRKRKVRTGPAPRSTHVPGTLLSLGGVSQVIQNGLRQTFGSPGEDKQYLTTVIPYEKKAGSPCVEDLQILTKILSAMRDDSEKVPSLLTDYILKVLCPT